MTEVLRPARAFDMADCAAIVDAWIEDTPWVPRVHPPAEIARHFRCDVFPAQAVTVAEARGSITGFMARDGGCVTSLYISLAARGRGLGARLLDRAKAEAGPLALWAFAANTPARRFYLRQGFREGRRSDGDNAEGLPDVEYLWDAA